MNQNIKVAVIGGTGKAGKYLVKHLLSQGFKIRVLTRDPQKLKIADQLVEIITGDVTDYESVHILMESCSVVISALGQTKGEAPVFTFATKNIIKAMDVSQIKRYIVLTGLTLDTPSDNKGFKTAMKSLVMKILFSRVVRDKKNEYKILNESNLDWTIVRVPFIELTEDRKNVEVSLSDCKGSGISSADLADFLVGQINDERFIRKAPFIWNS